MTQLKNKHVNIEISRQNLSLLPPFGGLAAVMIIT